MRVARYGRHGVLLEFDGGASAAAAYRALRGACDDGRLTGITELVPAARTVLVRTDGAPPPVDHLRGLLRAATGAEHRRGPAGFDDTGADTGADTRPEPSLVTLRVRYDGADLDLVARTAGLSVDEVVRLHSGAGYTVAFCGFAPGFGYLVGLPEPLRQPRLPEPRSSVPAGSIGIAGDYTGVYPRASPGGWRLLGRTDEVLFDPDADPPARLAPGTRVRFEPVGVSQRAGVAEVSAPGRAERGASVREGTLTVLRTGPLTLVTDLGRPGLSHLGVPRSGALDAPALRLANRLVGNPECRAGLEVLLGGLEVRAEAGCTLAVTGAPTAVALHRDGGRDPDGGDTRGRAVGSHRAVYLRAGDRLVVAAPGGGLRNYLAVAGGVDVAPVLGSRSSDLLSGLGPAPLRAGDRLLPGPASDPPAHADPVPVSVPPDTITVPILLGPRDDWLDGPAEALRRTRWTVDPASNRIGLRLRGDPLRRHPDRTDSELPSEPVYPGAVQVPPGGQPVVFLADGPTTGGYPVVGVVDEDWLPALAQARPGCVVRLRPSSS